jgi:hypothetical protein
MPFAVLGLILVVLRWALLATAPATPPYVSCFQLERRIPRYQFYTYVRVERDNLGSFFRCSGRRYDVEGEMETGERELRLEWAGESFRVEKEDE